jgi:hypothetical protein
MNYLVPIMELPVANVVSSVQELIKKNKVVSCSFSSEGPGETRYKVSNFSFSIAEYNEKILALSKGMTNEGWKIIPSAQSSFTNVLFNKDNTICCFYKVK